MSHYTAWADEEVAGLSCDGENTGEAVSLGSPVRCPKCGKLIRLVWHVYFEEVSEASA